VVQKATVKTAPSASKAVGAQSLKAAESTPQKVAPASTPKTSTPIPAPTPKAQAQAPSKGNPVSTEYGTRKKLNASELKFFENLLNEKKETLLQEFRYLEDNSMRLNPREGAGDISSHAYHLADNATETQDREQAFHMASREGKFLYYIEEALDRVRAGTFGICKKCQNLIPKARLEAVPTAKMCIQCKQSAEQESAPLPTQAS
jgi:DnaK suppressor protein